jgi:hypothetical protein
MPGIQERIGGGVVVPETTMANKYIGILRSQAATGYDQAAAVLGTPNTWFLGFLLSMLMFVVFYFSSYASSMWGATAASEMLANASKNEIEPMMRKIDPDMSKASMTFDFREGLLSAAQFNDGVDGLWNNLYNYMTSKQQPIAEPGTVNEYVVVQPDGVENVVRQTMPMPEITLPIDEVIGFASCDLSREEATRFLCERGIVNNRRAKRALNSLRYCKREMEDARGCSMWRGCTKQIIGDHFSSEVKSGISAVSTVQLGNGRVANIPTDLC